MTEMQQWGRKESSLWPPRGFSHTYLAIFLAILASGVLIFIHYRFALSPLGQYYLPYYLRTNVSGLAHPASTYQLVYITDGKSRLRIALDADVRAGQPPYLSEKPLPFTLSEQAVLQGFRSIVRE